ncbi:MAG: hypothetical protein B7X04_02105 [Parcubacteria group bacterium 21-54-25]|nr:MAG: hypothetical protein B7X04_02105 [Parcubacteria group bacterium 21-54-25]
MQEIAFASVFRDLFLVCADHPFVYRLHDTSSENIHLTPRFLQLRLQGSLLLLKRTHLVFPQFQNYGFSETNGPGLRVDGLEEFYKFCIDKVSAHAFIESNAGWALAAIETVHL